MDVDKILRAVNTNPDCVFLSRSKAGLQWYTAPDDASYLVTDAAIAQHRQDVLRKGIKADPPKAAVLSMIATISPARFALTTEGLYASISQASTSVYGHGSAVFEDPEQDNDNSTFHAAVKNLIDVASAILPASADICHADGLFNMRGERVGIQLEHNFLSVRTIHHYLSSGVTKPALGAIHQGRGFATR